MPDSLPDRPVELDLTGLKCPLPALRTRKALRALPPGARLAVACTDPLAGIDIPNLVREEGAALEAQERAGSVFRFVIRRGSIRSGDAPDDRDGDAMPPDSPAPEHPAPEHPAPKIRGTRTVHDGWASFLIADVTLPDGHEVTREIEDHGEAVAVLPYDPERRVALLVRQFRTPPFFAAGLPELLEAPAGLLDEVDPQEGARREAFEETGVRLGRLDPVTTAWSMPGVSTERMHLFLAPYAEGDRTGPGGGLAEEHEGITILEMPLAELAARAEAGEIADMKTYALILALRLRRPELFA